MLAQLRYIIGDENFEETLKRDILSDWAFKHPTPNDFFRSAEKTIWLGVGMVFDRLDPNHQYTIDYGVKGAVATKGQTKITLERVGLMPMPVEIQLILKDGSTVNYYIPLQMMRGEKPIKDSTVLLNDWAWSYPEYSFSIDVNTSEIESITLDVNNATADVNKENNQLKVL